MKRIIFWSIALVIALFMSMAAQAKTQDIGGKVIDENGQPLPYVNVVLLSLPDSAFVQGAMTDEQGMFNIVTNQSQGVMKLSSIGYETVFLDYKAANAKYRGSGAGEKQKARM